MPAVSKKQQKFFGIVRAIQKGEQAPTTPETAKAAADMKKSDVKKFASTKHKGLPNKVVQKEESNPRIPRKKGQPAGSKKHSDLYTDENPKGTIHGLGFKDVATAKASVSKIRNSSRSHAHKIQAAVAMEQRAREMGKPSEAAVYRKYINSMKKKTKSMKEAFLPFGKRPKIGSLGKSEGSKRTLDAPRIPGDGSNARLSTDKMRQGGDGSNVSDDKQRKFKKAESTAKVTKDTPTRERQPDTVREGMHNHPEFALITVAVDELEKGLMVLGAITYKLSLIHISEPTRPY